MEANIIEEDTAMTAAEVHTGFCDTFDCELSADEFIKGFRVAVRAGKITGIESAKRLGYRKVGSAGKPSASKTDPTLEAFTPYLSDVQEFVSANIKGDVRMTAAVIYNKFKLSNGCELTEDEFIKGFRYAIRDKKITGLESAYRFGYREAGSGKVTKEDGDSEAVKAGHDVCEIIIDDRRKVVALDRLNWGYQVRKDSGAWVTEAYFSNFYNGIRSVACKLMDDELKGSEQFPVDQLLEKMEEAESRITDLLLKAFHHEKSEVIEDAA